MAARCGAGFAGGSVVITSGLSHRGAILRPNAGTNFRRHHRPSKPASPVSVHPIESHARVLRPSHRRYLGPSYGGQTQLMWHRGGRQPRHRGDEQCKGRNALMGFGRLSLSFSSSRIHTHLQVFACVQSFSCFYPSRLCLHTPSFPPSVALSGIMPSFLSAATVLTVLAIFARSVSATTFHSDASDNLAVYWVRSKVSFPAVHVLS